LCPFHEERTPSFTVNERDQTYHCFGCHSSGDVIDFVAQRLDISYYDALIKLRNRLYKIHGLSTDRNLTEEQKEIEELVKLADWRQLIDWKELPAVPSFIDLILTKIKPMYINQGQLKENAHSIKTIPPLFDEEDKLMQNVITSYLELRKEFLSLDQSSRDGLSELAKDNFNKEGKQL
jgi:hypothetical protein